MFMCSSIIKLFSFFICSYEQISFLRCDFYLSAQTSSWSAMMKTMSEENMTMGTSVYEYWIRAWMAIQMAPILLVNPLKTIQLGKKAKNLTIDSVQINQKKIRLRLLLFLPTRKNSSELLFNIPPNAVNRATTVSSDHDFSEECEWIQLDSTDKKHFVNSSKCIDAKRFQSAKYIFIHIIIFAGRDLIWDAHALSCSLTSPYLSLCSTTETIYAWLWFRSSNIISMSALCRFGKEERAFAIAIAKSIIVFNIVFGTGRLSQSGYLRNSSN